MENDNKTEKMEETAKAGSGKSKMSYEMRRAMKEMEDKKRKEAMATVAVTYVAPPGEDANKLSFDQYWMILNGKVKLRPHMKEVVWADFAARGLSKKETMSAYDEALRLFGIKC